MKLSTLASGALVAASLSLVPAASAAPARTHFPAALGAATHAVPDLGRASSLEPVDVLVALRHRHEAALQRFIGRVSDPGSSAYQRFLTPRAFVARFAPTSAQAAAVERFARANGFTASTPVNRAYVELRGTVGQAERAFGTRLDRFRVAGRLVHAPVLAPSIPARLGRFVSGIDGLDTGAVAHPMASSAPAAFVNAPPCSSYWGEKQATDKPAYDGSVRSYATCGYTPDQLQGAYGVKDAIAGGLNGAGQTVGIIDAWAYTNAASDADTWSSKHGLPPVAYTDVSDPVAQNVPELPEGGAGFVDPDGWAGEQMLDIEAVHAMAPGAKIVFEGSDSPLGSELEKVQNDMVANHRAQIVSNSYGSADDTADTTTHATLEQAAATGIGFYVSSGDEGDETQDPNGPGDREVDSFANDPLATAVGGTSLAVGQGDTYGFETGWGTSAAALSGSSWATPTWSYGGGGGTSQSFAQPDYQKGIVPDAIASYFQGKPAEASQGSGFTPFVPGRAVPDVAMDGDPNTGMLEGITQNYTVIGGGSPVGGTAPPVDLPAPVGDVHYGEYRIGGTSLASPLFAGVMALADQAAGKPHGFANPALYAAGANGAFRDIDKPASTQAVVRNDYVNGVDDSDGVSTSLRLLDQINTLHDLPGYDDITGLGSPSGASFLQALAPGATIPGA
ncbi:MAG: serine protease [Solirubrobacteraceae bacterium]|nr:serine protease [Solirubrobacteraceae bacterium]